MAIDPTFTRGESSPAPGPTSSAEPAASNNVYRSKDWAYTDKYLKRRKWKRIILASLAIAGLGWAFSAVYNHYNPGTNKGATPLPNEGNTTLTGREKPVAGFPVIGGNVVIHAGQVYSNLQLLSKPIGSTHAGESVCVVKVARIDVPKNWSAAGIPRDLDQKETRVVIEFINAKGDRVYALGDQGAVVSRPDGKNPCVDALKRMQNKPT